MELSYRHNVILAALLAGAVSLAAAQQKTDLRYTVQPGATVTITNDTGSVFVRPVTGNQVLISAAPFSAKVEVDGNQAGSRVDIRSHILQKPTGEEGRVDYSVQMPSGTAVIIRVGSGAVRVQGASADVTVDTDTGSVEVSDGGNAHVHVRTMGAPVILSRLRNAHVEVTSVSGELTLSNVSGPQVSANTTGAPIHLIGDCSGDGEYTLSTHSGNIEVILPATASVEVTARSVNGTVEDAFQLLPAQHPSMAITAGKSFAGRANSGASSIQLRSFSGKITVKKQ
jgi:carbon monoxide dehydrogenase subunit G